MSRNRYVGDYRIVESIDGRGRVKTDYEYIGAPYVYAGDAASVKAARTRVALGCAVGWAAWVAALIPVSAAMRALYIALPFAFAAVPLALWAGTAISLFRTREPFEHRHADRLENRAPACTFFVALLGVVALIGEAVNVLRGAEWMSGDAMFALCAAILTVSAIVCHRQWKRLKCRKAE
ncbi:MAG: hypothetical protein IKF98_01925 [Clostridia bacterium]|nr:hypothetical protein [Clostridia bacterium]